MTNKVSIIVPCYNQAHYLNEALQSVLEQTCTNWECIIVNDGSPDNTQEIAQNWTKKDSRFRYIKKENGGLSSARNTGIELARGEFILPLDADDKIGKQYVELALKEFKKDLDLKLVYCNAEKFGDEIGAWEIMPFSLFNMTKDNVIFCSAIYRKKEWQLVGGYDIKMLFGLEDYEFWISLLKNGGNVLKLNYCGFYYRIKSNSMITSMKYENQSKMLNHISIKHADFFISQLGNFIQISNELQNSKFALNSRKHLTKMFFKKVLFNFSYK